MGLYNPKIDQETAKNVKIQIMKNNNFCLKTVFFLTKNVIFQNFTFYIFAVFWSIFGLYRPILPFWNSQSLIIKLMYAYQHNRK